MFIIYKAKVQFIEKLKILIKLALNMNIVIHNLVNK
jgi:hypothetical protein